MDYVTDFANSIHYSRIRNISFTTWEFRNLHGHDANGGIKIVDQWPNNGPDDNHPFEHTLARHDQGHAMHPALIS